MLNETSWNLATELRSRIVQFVVTNNLTATIVPDETSSLSDQNL